MNINRDYFTKSEAENYFCDISDIPEIESGKESFIKAYGIYSSNSHLQEEDEKSFSKSIYASRSQFLAPSKSFIQNVSLDDFQFNHKRNSLMRNFSHSSRLILDNLIPITFENLKENDFDFSVFEEETEINNNMINLCGALLNICYTLADTLQFMKKGDLKRAKFAQKSKTYEYAECDRKKYKERLAGKFGIFLG